VQGRRVFPLQKIRPFRMAAAAIEKLNSEVQYGVELKKVCPTPAMSPVAIYAVGG